MSESAIHCRYHCTSCEGHFASLAAFDEHRVGSYRRGRRRCLTPQEMRALRGEEHGRAIMRLVRNGVCRLTKGNDRLEGAKIWQTR